MAHPWDQILAELDEAHQALQEGFAAGPLVMDALRGVRGRLAEEAEALGDSLWEREPAPGEWSLREVMEHVLAHDWRWDEGNAKGVDHYCAHGWAHVEQAVKIRRLLRGED